MKTIKSITAALVICTMFIITACKENQNSLVTSGSPSEIGRNPGNSEVPVFETEITLKPGQSSDLTDNIKNKSISGLEILNLSNYGNIVCSDIGIYFNDKTDGADEYFSACLAHQEIFTVTKLTKGNYVKIENQSERTLTLQVKIW
ncbi:MAG: hypothetical protein HGGPFJEG_02917 [Ignavibacteria bacterium]|nr:hypothetical protein [Ignavibacteria bacterium]